MKKMQKILSLKPTQFAVGMLEVDEKLALALKLSKKQRKDYIKGTEVPVVLSPYGEMYITDHHHFLCVCYHLRVEKVKVKIIADHSGKKMTFQQFWKWMDRQRSVYPYCQFGEGPRQPLYLPKDIRGLADDPYRSLAWFVRKAGAFENSDKNFAEFQWANFFRSKKLLDRGGLWAFPRALVQATKLAQSPEAKHLPGFGKLNMQQQKKTRRKLKAQVSKTLRAAS
jgi:hypothetical protein